VKNCNHAQIPKRRILCGPYNTVQESPQKRPPTSDIDIGSGRLLLAVPIDPLNEAEEIVEPPRAVHVLLLEELLDIRNLHHCLVFWVKLILRGSDVRLDWQGIIRCWLLPSASSPKVDGEAKEVEKQPIERCQRIGQLLVVDFCDLHASVPAHQAGQEDEVEELDLDLAASRDENVEPDLPNEEGVAEVGAADDGPRVEVDNGKEDPDENAEEGQDQELAVDVDRSP